MVICAGCTVSIYQCGCKYHGNLSLKPVINKFIVPGDTTGLIRAAISMGVMYLCGALSTFAYNRLMVVTSQKVIKEIRNDLLRTRRSFH